MCSASQYYFQVGRFGTPTWRRLVEAVENRVGGNNHALALKIAAEHTQCHLLKVGGSLLTSVCTSPMCIRTWECWQLVARHTVEHDYSYSFNKTSVGLGWSSLQSSELNCIQIIWNLCISEVHHLYICLASQHRYVPNLYLPRTHPCMWFKQNS